MSKKPSIAVVTGSFQVDWNCEVQELTALRIATKLSQQTMADKIGVSLRSIQRFENFDSHSALIMYHYKQISNQ